MHRITAGAVVLLLAAGCASDGDSASTTTVTTTTLPPSSTSTTLPPRSVTEVDACSLLRDVDLERVLDDAGPGEAAPVDDHGREGLPALVTARCSWPSLDAPALSLHYLAPTTAPDGPSHLTDVLETGTGFAEGGTVITQDVEGETVGILVDEHQQLRELAVVKRSALLYLLVEEEVGARDEAALTAYREILYNALVRAPR